jgi:hypothetical protein
MRVFNQAQFAKFRFDMSASVLVNVQMLEMMHIEGGEEQQDSAAPRNPSTDLLFTTRGENKPNLLFPGL